VSKLYQKILLEYHYPLSFEVKPKRTSVEYHFPFLLWVADYFNQI